MYWQVRRIGLYYINILMGEKIWQRFEKETNELIECRKKLNSKKGQFMNLVEGAVQKKVDETLEMAEFEPSIISITYGENLWKKKKLSV